MAQSAAEQSDQMARFDIRPNSSLTPSGTWLFLGTAGIACLGPAVALLTQGFWPVLPFAGLEFTVLTAATWWSIRKGRYREVIIIRDSAVSVDKFSPTTHHHWESPIHWCRASLLGKKSGSNTQKLVLQAGMKSCEVASCCTDSERVRLWQRLHGLIGPINQTPQPRTTTFKRVEPDSNQEVGTHVQ
mgnify:CR=1 FL=1